MFDLWTLERQPGMHKHLYEFRDWLDPNDAPWRVTERATVAKVLKFGRLHKNMIESCPSEGFYRIAHHFCDIRIIRRKIVDTE